MFTIEYATSNISVFDVDNFIAKVDQLNHKAAKRGIQPITFEIGETTKYKVDGKYWYSEQIVVEMTLVSISYPVYKIDGWKLLGKVDHKENIVLSVKGCEVPDVYRNSEPKCEHCNTNRDRNETFILFDGSNYKQVGRSCLGLFFGVDSEMILTMSDNAFFARYINAEELTDDDMDLFDTIKFKRYFYDLPVYLAFVAQQMRLNGWISRDKASTSYCVATSDLAFDDMLDIKDESKKISEPTKEDRKLADDVIGWASGLTDFECGEYLRNLRQIARNGYFSKKVIGYAASMIVAYNKANSDKIAKAVTSSHIGTVGEKLSVDVTLKYVSSPIYGTYGVSYINTFADQFGNLICWKTSYAVGEGSYTLTAKVKSHDRYNGNPQTWVERAKLTEIG